MLKDGRSPETHFLKYGIYDPKYVDAFFIKNDPFSYVLGIHLMYLMLLVLHKLNAIFILHLH